MRFIWMAAALMAAPAFADDAPRLYQSDTAIEIKAAPGATSSAQTDPLVRVNQINLTLSFTCAQAAKGAAPCGQSAFELLAESDGSDKAALNLAAKDGVLQPGAVRRQGDASLPPEVYKLTPRPGETFDVHIHWTQGNRVSFDLYRKDPVTEAETMESQDVQLSGPVQDLKMWVTGGSLVISHQIYLFR